jgi:hypothetical protein
MDHGWDGEAPYNLCLCSQGLCRMASFVSADHEGMADLEGVDLEDTADLEGTAGLEGMNQVGMVELEGMADQEGMFVLGWQVDAYAEDGLQAGHSMSARPDGTADAGAYSSSH